MTRIRLRHGAGAAVVCLALAVVHTWPLASAPHRRSLNYNADAQLNAWIVSWVAYALGHAPSQLYAGNIFQPDSHALAYSEPLLVPAIVGAPVRWLGGSAVLTFNLLLILGLAATALAAGFTAWRWTGSAIAAATAGSLAAFNTHLLTRLPHLQAAHAWGLPLAMYFTDRLVATEPIERRDEARVVVLLAVVIAAIAMTSEYWLVLAAVIMVAQAVSGARSLRAIVRLAIAGSAGVALALPALFPYLQLAAGGIRRPLEQAAQLSASPTGYLVSLSRIDAWWSHRFFTRDIDVLFPGAVALLLATAGALAARGSDAATRRRVASLLIVAAVGFVLSLGPSTPIYTAAYHLIVPLQGLRVPARFGYLVLLAVAMLAGFGVSAIGRRVRHPAAAAAAGMLAFVLVNVEAWHGEVPTTPFRGVPRIYSLLDREPGRVLLAETPFWPAETVFGNGEYVLAATEHRAPTANGYSGFTPDLYRKRAQWFWFFPEPWAIDAMRSEGITHVMVHLEQFGSEAPAVLRTLAQQHDLELLASDDEGHRLYRFVPRTDRP
jgi:hypothetical protein